MLLVIVRIYLLIFLFIVPYHGHAATLSPVLHKKLTSIQNLVKKNQITKAINQFKQQLKENRKNRYAQAIIYNQLAYAYLAKKNYKKAREAFELALKKNALPKKITQGLRYNLVQLYAQEKKFTLALKQFKKWLKSAPRPTANQYAQGASIAYQQKHYKTAISYLRKISSKQMRQEWQQLLISCYQKTRNNQAALKLLLKKPIYTYQYWQTIAQFYLTAQQPNNALAATELAYKQGLLKQEKELFFLIHLYQQQGIPQRAALVLEKALQQGIIEKNAENSKKLAELWLAMNNDDKALVSLQEAAAIKTDSIIDAYLGFLLAKKQQWQLAYKHLQRSVNTTLSPQVNTLFLLGTTAYQLNKYDEAHRAFKQILAHSSQHRAAQIWLKKLAQNSTNNN